tara:strand:- start:279 stop:536 length:258 start_codon:yes stop_codon:yes gene_type:complete
LAVVVQRPPSSPLLVSIVSRRVFVSVFHVVIRSIDTISKKRDRSAARSRFSHSTSRPEKGRSIIITERITAANAAVSVPGTLRGA